MKNYKKIMNTRLIDEFMLNIYLELYDICEIDEYNKDIYLLTYSALLIL